MTNLEKVPKRSFNISYLDSEGDQIDLTSNQDVTALKESMSDFPEVSLFITSSDELKFVESWSCSICTFNNKLESIACEICESAKPGMKENKKNDKFSGSVKLLTNVHNALKPILEPMINTFVKKEPKKEEVKEQKVE